MSSLSSDASVENPLSAFHSTPSPQVSRPSLPTAADSAGMRPSQPQSATQAVVVSYEPDPASLSTLLQEVRSAGVQVLVVDNSETDAGRAAARKAAQGSGAEYIGNPLNLGVAAAHNIGLQLARERGAAQVLLLDQDSRLSPQAIAMLHAALERLRATGESVAAVGPSLVDPRCGRRLPFGRLGWLRMRRLAAAPGDIVRCDALISSGCLIDVQVLTRTGLLDEKLFIDCVDLEWCARTVAAGYRLYGVADAQMAHTIGEAAVRVLGRTVPLHGPLRHYYFIRNALLFIRKPGVSLRWRLHLAYRIVGQFTLFSLLRAPRLQRLRWMFKGLWDGLLGRGGRLGGPRGLKVLSPQGKVAQPVGVASAATNGRAEDGRPTTYTAG